MDTRTIVIVIAGLLGSSGFLGGIYALLKLRPEAGQITVATAQGVLVMQTSVIDDLREENARLQGRIDALEAENSSLMRRLEAIEYKLLTLERGGRKSDEP